MGSARANSGRAVRVLVTGANGFIGKQLVLALGSEFEVRAAVRGARGGVSEMIVGHPSAGVGWANALDGCTAVVHLAGPAHRRVEEGILQRDIAEATAALAARAAQAGVQRFVYLSSIHAAARRSRYPLDETPAASPHGAYGRAKRRAEVALLAHAELNPLVLRAPLVHGPGARGNWLRLLKLVDSGLPLPLAGLSNRRSVIALASLCAAIRAALLNTGPSGVFHVADQPALSTPEIVSLMRSGLGRPARLFKMPGIGLLAPRALVESLVIDNSRFRAAFGFCGVESRQAVEASARAWKKAL